VSEAFSLDAFAARAISTPQGRISFRRGAASTDSADAPIVLLHGIGSSAASWAAVANALNRGSASAQSLLAWDAPGYGESTHLQEESPCAQHYSEAMWQWLDALHVQWPITLVGHSLGALIAASACAVAPSRVQRLILLSPAQGYHHLSADERAMRASARLELLLRLGAEGMARERGMHMCSANASEEMIAFAQWNMAQVNVRGYTHATHMLMNGNIAADLAKVRCPVVIANGQADTITPPENARMLAAQFGANYVSLGPVGHACAIEAPNAVAALLQGL
jgi:pimeloyl-ACP methyl ester carboxylesterase